jgi:phage-related protein
MADDFTVWCPSVPMQTSNERRMNVAQYGDGYQQRQLDGINALSTTFSVTYETRDMRTLEAMNVYLTAQKAKSFKFRHPATQVLIDVFCNEWDIDWDMVQWDWAGKRTVYGTLSADFIRAYGLGV